MAFYHRTMDRKRSDYKRHEGDVIGSLCRLGGRPVSPKSLLEQEKRIRREIANSNERRRMQSINDGFQSLRSLLPHRDGEKLSKAAILHSAADYVLGLEEKVRNLQDLIQPQHQRLNSPSHVDSDGSNLNSPPLLKRRKRDTVDSVDEGIGSSSPARSDNETDDVKRENVELRLQLSHERALRKVLEEQVRGGDCPRCSSDCVSDSSDHGQMSHVKGLKMLSKTSRNFCPESGIGSPLSQLSSQDIESPRILSPRVSSPELSDIQDNGATHVNTVLVPCTSELLAASVPSTIITNSHHFSTSDDPYCPIEYKISTSRQNLDTIVEAIRLVEGDHMFRDDPKDLETQHEVFLNSLESQTSLQPVITKQFFTPSRPGVIVPNPS